MTTPARVEAALKILGLTELQAQARGLSFDPNHAPLEVRGILDGSVALDEEPAEDLEAVEVVEEKPVEDAPEAEAAEPEGEESAAEEAAEEGTEEPAEESAEGEPEAEEAVANPAEGVNIDAFEGLAAELTDEQLTAALKDTRKGIQVIAQAELDKRAAE